MYQPVDFQSLFVQLQSRYPTSSLMTELVQIHDNRFIVRALVQVGGVTLATSMATGATVELAEDQARSRLFSLLGVLPTSANAIPSDIAHAISPSGTPSQVTPPKQPWSDFPSHFATPDATTSVGPTTSIPPATSLNHASATPLLTSLPQPPAVVTPERSSGSELSLLREPSLLSSSPNFDTEISSPEAEPTPAEPLLPTYPDVDLEIMPPEPQPPASIPFSSSYDGLDLDDTVAIDDEFPLEERLLPIEPLPPVESVVPSSRPTKSSRSKTSKAAADTAKTPTPTDTPIDLAPLFLQIEQEMERIHWTKEQGRDHLKQTYGKRSRQQLTDEELLDFLNYLKARPLYEEA